MVNNNQPKIGCNLGEGASGSRTKIIDPNSFYGETDSSRNIPVRIEDLTISVKLTTRKKSRTTISSDSTENTTVTTEQKGSTINFIGGSDINGKKVLTTKFTELTTIFESEGETINPETFGITNIDIDFNTSYTPMIKIDFIDVRGSSIFQNEDSLLNGKNKYSTFFEFPYPLFELEIKGYYGQPVTYCLHMLKFNSKFNSQTGNFEISCEFIGYTYAMLSDILVGILRAIPYTRIGKSKFNNYVSGGTSGGTSSVVSNIITLPQLKILISKIDESIQKAAESSEESKSINTFTQSKDILDNLDVLLTNYDEFSIASDKTVTTPVINRFVILSLEEFSDPQKTRKKAIDDDIKKLVTEYNELNISGLSIRDTDIINPTVLTDLNLKKLEPNSGLQPFGPLKNASEVTTFKTDLLSYLKNTFPTTINENTAFSVFDLRSRFDLIESQRTLVSKSLTDSNKALANRIKDNVSKTLGFNPTVRNMVEIFTALIEVFIESVYEVSTKAESNNTRKELLKNVFGDKLEGSDYTDANFYPWPAYSEKNDIEGYKDKYLGSVDSLKSRISDIDELAFIDDLLQGFLTANAIEKQADLLNAGNETIFIPTNPLDTNLFQTNSNPYAKVELINFEQAKRLMLIRAMTFLGYTNNQEYLTKGEEGEIQKMADLEAKMLLDALINIKVKLQFKNLTLSSLITTFGKINGEDRPVVNLKGDEYYYNYITKDNVDGVKLIPVGYDINDKTIEINTKDTVEQKGMLDFKDEEPNGNIFLTNYSSSYGANYTVDNTKYDDGGVYLKIKTINEYTPSPDSTLYDTTLKTESVLDLKALKSGSIASAGFNSFGGPYGIQEFSKITFDDSEPAGTPFMYVFYQNDVRNGLANTRIESKSLKSKYDFNKNSTNNISLVNSISTDYLNGDNGNKLHTSLGKSRTLATKIDLNTSAGTSTYPYVNIYLDYNNKNSMSLFGSKFYYIQQDAKIGKTNVGDYVKGLLFLNTLPFNIDYDTNEDPFNKPEILHLFDVKGGFIRAPRLWAAYVGGLLWWLSTKAPKIENGLIVGGGRGVDDPIIWKHKCTANPSLFIAPSANKYLPKSLKGERNTIPKSSPLITLPIQVKEEFKRIFFDFINSDSETSFKSLAESLEIYKGTATNFCGLVDTLLLKNTFNGSVVVDNFKNYANYNMLLPINNLGISYIFLELRDNSKGVKKLLTSFTEEIIIANTGVKIWENTTTSQQTRIDQEVRARTAFADPFGINTPAPATPAATTTPPTSKRVGVTVKKAIFDEYFNKLIAVVSDAVSGSTVQNETENQVNEVFGTSNKNDVKLMLYRHCKNIYDKWLGGVTDSKNVIFQCGDRNTIDTSMAKRYNRDKPRLIDSFRFVTRSFKDIGDELFINPLPIEQLISNNPNTSAYSVISGLLNDNKFDFQSLPTFINYRDEKMLQSVFTPYEYNNTITSCGPTFICVYTGQKSNSLDIKSGKYPNDGFDLKCLNGNIDKSVPADFSDPLNDYEDPVSVFIVNYSQQNQNIFKDITLDQSEFTETEESLKIVQDISMNGSESKPTFGGQNMYNVYAVRSYSAEIEMLGNAMIQPMMYFQLNNVPMFHGAYMIIRTKHNIKPNHMTTWFTGTRIRAVESPIIDVADAYMSLIETLDLSKAGNSGSATVSGSFPPIVKTIIENGGSNGNVEFGNIKLVPVEQITDVEQDVPKERRKMIAEAVPALTEMLTEFSKFAKAEGYPTIKKKYVGITSLYRSYEYQQELYDKNIKKGGKPGAVAEPGFSNHSWGIAVDLLFAPQKSGTYLKVGEWAPIDTDANKEGFSFEYNPSLKWFLDNSWKFGFIIPVTLRDGLGNVDEYWHFEYHGTSAKCLYNKLPSTYGYTPKLNSGYKSVVKNPKGVDGKEVVYLENECDFKYISTGDGGVSGVPNSEIINSLTGGWVERSKLIIISFESYAAKAYWDSNAWRGGYGTDNIIVSEGTQPSKVTSSTTFTKVQAQLTLTYDINNRFKKSIIGVLGQKNWDKLNDNQKAAIMSYSYNSGAGTLKKRGIVESITKNNFKQAASQIAAGPITSDGKVLPGLVSRRKTEAKIFEKPV
jgi:GH24 family phage-related lysozyme (muramidase)/LAS superfamily LD-carboxypeptidase LdcB